MKIIQRSIYLREIVSSWKSQGEKICFIPTMGALHDGHLALVEHAMKLKGRIVVSIFVNPLQFNNNDDLDKYPKTLGEDLTKLAGKVDAVFTPNCVDMYPNGIEYHTKVKVPIISDILEGESRPGHFDGVATVVVKLFSIILPDYSFFGEKDYQQLLLIRKISDDLLLGGNIIGIPTVREKNGIAMSSRNKRLTGEEYKKAPAIYEILNEAREKIIGGTNIEDCHNFIETKLNTAGIVVDEAFIRDAADLSVIKPNTEKVVILLSAWVGKVRLIDNIIFNYVQ